MASVMKVTANGTTTSPMIRGAWVLDRILGTPPPNQRWTWKRSSRTSAARRRSASNWPSTGRARRARACHAKIDPPGFALESFDVIGGWREKYRSVGKGEPVIVDGRRMRYLQGAAVDPADVTPDGQRFGTSTSTSSCCSRTRTSSPAPWPEKLLTYATGGPPGTRDRAALDAIVAKVRGKDYGLRTLVHEIVQSEVFQTK